MLRSHRDLSEGAQGEWEHHLSEQVGEVICIVHFPDPFSSSSFRGLDHDRVANLLSSLARGPEQQDKDKKAVESSEKIIISSFPF